MRCSLYQIDLREIVNAIFSTHLKELKMIIYEYAIQKVTVENLEKSLTDYSKAGWEVVNIMPSIYSSVNMPYTELMQLMVVLRSPIGNT